MLLIIHNLPFNTNLAWVKQLIKDQCNITDIIVDNLSQESQGKRATIGLAHDSDAALLIKKINGMYINGQQLYVEDVRQKKRVEYPYSLSNPLQNLMPTLDVARGRPMQASPAPVPPVQISAAQEPMAYNNMPFYMTPVLPILDQRNYVGNKTSAPLNTSPAQVPFYQQDTGFRPKKPNICNNENRWKNQAITYPVSGFNQKTQESLQEQREVGHHSPREWESNWRNNTENVTQNVSMMNTWSGSRSYDVTQNNWNDRDERQRSPRDRSHRDRSPRDRPSRDQSARDRPPRERSRDRALRNRSPGNRSRQRGNRRENDFQSRDRHSRADRSSPRSRRDQRDDRDRRLGNRHDERHDKFERPDNDRGRHDGHNRDIDYRRPNCDVDQRGNQNRINRNQEYVPKRPRPENFQQNPSVYSSSPNNSTFIQPNANTFNQKSVFQLGNIANRYDPDPRGPPNKIMRVSGNEPPAGFNKPIGKFNPPAESAAKFDCKVQKDSNPPQALCMNKTLSAKLSKQGKWIIHASGILSKQIIVNARANMNSSPNFAECLKNLKKCIVSRIEVILHNRISRSLQEILMAYRSKFSIEDDPHFFKAVMDKIERDTKESENLQSDEKESEESFTEDAQTPGPSNTEDVAPKGEPDGFRQYTQEDRIKAKRRKRGKHNRANMTIAAGLYDNSDSVENDEEVKLTVQNPRLNITKPEDPTQRLPRFPQGDKQVYKDQKKLLKMEYNEEIYTLEPSLKKALDDEMELLCAEYSAACEEPTGDTEQTTYRMKIKNDVLAKFKKVVKLHITKRLLNLPNNLVIRIFAHPKPPKRDVVEEFLKKYDVASFKKTEKKYQTFFLVTCTSYKTYDELLNMGKYKVSDTCTLQFKAMHLTGPKDAGHMGKMKKGKSIIHPDNRIHDDEVNQLLEADMEFDVPGNDDDSQDGGENRDFDDNITDDRIELGNDDFTTNDNLAYDDFTDWDNKPPLNDSDVVYLENKHDLVVIDDNDKTVTEIVENEGNNDTNNEGANVNETGPSNGDQRNDGENLEKELHNYDNLDQNTNVLDEAAIEGVDVTEDDLEDF